jgi:single-strand DNA-binding protein
MASLNKVLLMGNLTRQPELRYTNSGAAVCEFGLAMSRRFTTNGQERDEVCFVDIIVWGKQAENVNRYLEKGSSAFVEGRLILDQWEDKQSGAKRSRIRVTAERVQFMSRRNDSSGGQQGGYQQTGQQQDSGYNNPPPASQGQGFQQANSFGGNSVPAENNFQAAPAPTNSFAPAPPAPPANSFSPAPSAPQQPSAPDSFNVSSESDDDIPF